jgi:diaminopimelate decarboxylase
LTPFAGASYDGRDMLLPPGAGVDDRGHLCFGGADVVELAERFGTPLYVFDEGVLRERCRAFRDAFAGYEPGARVAYAAKAFWNLAMARICDEEGLDLDVVSGGELYTALEAGFPAARAHFHGNNKSPEEIEYALDAGVGRFVVDNFHELELLDGAARRRGRRQPVLLRVAPGVEAHTHSYVQTGKQDSKFGFDLATGQAMEAARRAARSDGLDLVGLHAHVASQMFDVAVYRVAAEKLLDLAVQIRLETDVLVRELNVGGGPGIRYTEGDSPFTPEAWGRAVTAALREGCAARDLPPPSVGVEPGRAIAGEAGIALYRVGSQKRVPGLAPFIAVDGGMGDNIRPALYGAEYRAAVANRMRAAEEERVTVVGRYCESGDFLARDLPLPRVAAGDLLAFFSAGAYQFAMSSQYNRVPRPAAVLVSGGRAELIVARETYADLMRQDRLPGHLSVPRGAPSVR